MPTARSSAPEPADPSSMDTGVTLALPEVWAGDLVADQLWRMRENIPDPREMTLNTGSGLTVVGSRFQIHPRFHDFFQWMRFL